MLTTGVPDIKAQFEIELSATLKHKQRSTCLIGGSLIYFIFCLAVCIPVGAASCASDPHSAVVPHSPVSREGSSCLAKICLLLGMFRKAAQLILSLLAVMVVFIGCLQCNVSERGINNSALCEY